VKSLTDLTNGIAARITAGFNTQATQPGLASLLTVAILVADAADLQSQLDTAVAQQGMIVLINMPSFKNQDILAQQINGKIPLAIEVGEAPDTWRDTPLTKPKAVDVAVIVARLLSQYFIPGFQPLRVMEGDFTRDKTRQVYTINLETQQIFDSL
jgi:hypothetical protein